MLRPPPPPPAPLHLPCCVLWLPPVLKVTRGRAAGPQAEAQMGTRYSVVTELMLRLLGLDYVANTLVHPSPRLLPPLLAHPAPKPCRTQRPLMHHCDVASACATTLISPYLTLNFSNVQIGGEMIRGVSGGQLKRCTTAEMIVGCGFLSAPGCGKALPGEMDPGCGHSQLARCTTFPARRTCHDGAAGTGACMHDSAASQGGEPHVGCRPCKTLMMDEISTGLDSSTTFQITKVESPEAYPHNSPSAGSTNRICHPSVDEMRDPVDCRSAGRCRRAGRHYAAHAGPCHNKQAADQPYSALCTQILANFTHMREATVLLALLQPAPEVGHRHPPTQHGIMSIWSMPSLMFPSACAMYLSHMRPQRPSRTRESLIACPHMLGACQTLTVLQESQVVTWR